MSRPPEPGDLPPPVGVMDGLRADLQKVTGPNASAGKKLFSALSNRGFGSLVCYRLSHALWRRGVPVLPLILSRFAQTFFATDIAYQAYLGPGIHIFHCFGLVIGNGVRIAGDCRLYHGVTLGTRGSEQACSPVTDGHPLIEENVVIAAGAKVLGPITIGRDALIGANAVVTKDVPPRAIAGGIPAKVLKFKPE